MVSVIIPNYNHAPYLRQRIESVLNQTYQDFEVILLDDKSTDNSVEILKEYANNPKVSHFIVNDINSGTTFKQWQKGIALAQGEFIWIAESDDYAELTFLEKLMASIVQYDSVIACACSLRVNLNGHTIRSQKPILEEEFCSKDDFLDNYLLQGNVIYNASTVVFCKDAINPSVWDEVVQLKYCGDWLFWAKLIMNGYRGISEVKEFLNYFRTHTANVSNKSEKKGLTFLEGFPISQMIAKSQHIRNKKGYCNKWFFEWQHYRTFYDFSKKTSLKILIMFTRKQPIIAFYEFRRLISRFFHIK